MSTRKQKRYSPENVTLTKCLIRHVATKGLDFGRWKRTSRLDFAEITGSIFGRLDDPQMHEVFIETALDHIPPERWARYLQRANGTKPTEVRTPKP